MAQNNKAATLHTEDQHDRSGKLSSSIAQAELLAYIDEARIDKEAAPFSKFQIF